VTIVPLTELLATHQEEAGIDAQLSQCGLLFFKLAGLNFAHKVFIFRADEYSGEVTEYVSCLPWDPKHAS
jgi:hypothetical protein